MDVDSFKGEFAVDEAEDEEGVLDSNEIGFDGSLGKELHGDKEDFCS